MRWAAFFSSLVVVGLNFGCSTLHPSAYQHPGITDPDPNAVTRTFEATSTLVAERLVDVMKQEEILENVVMYHDPANRECRSFTRADRQALGISPLTPANDVNFDVKAKCKNGQPVTVAVRLKGPSGAEVSILYGFAGDAELSRDLLDKVANVLAKSDSGVKTASAKASTAR